MDIFQFSFSALLQKGHNLLVVISFIISHLFNPTFMLERNSIKNAIFQEEILEQDKKLSCKKCQEMWFRRNIFFSDRSSICGAWGSVPLAHSTSGLSARIPSRPVSHWPVSAQRSLSPQCYVFRGRYSPPRAGVMGFAVHCCKFFAEGLRCFTRT